MTEADSGVSGPPGAVRVTFLGHATVCLELAGSVVLTDAVLRSRVAFLRWTAPAPVLDALRGIDAVLVSHLHHDHCDPASLALLGHDRTLLVPWGTEDFFREKGFMAVVAMRPGQSQRVGAVDVTATEAAHDGRRQPFGPRGPALGFVVAGGGRRVYFAGDTDLFPGMRDLGPGLDVALLPVAGWARVLGPGHLDPVRAADAVGLLTPALAVPIHWGALRPVWYRPESPEQTSAAASAFASEVRRRRLPSEVKVVMPGGSLRWPA